MLILESITSVLCDSVGALVGNKFKIVIWTSDFSTILTLLLLKHLIV